jgi:eukaryotic-like serine/threonine-protein kinase
MGDAEKTTILAAARGGYGEDDGWDDGDKQARKRKRRNIALVAVLGVLLLGGVIAAAIAMNGRAPETPAVQQVQVPSLVNQTEAAARQAITAAKLVVGQVSQRTTTDKTQQGKVLESSPAGGAQVDEGTEVNLVVGAAPDTVAVPNVVGLDEQRARDTLQRAGFTTVTIDRVDSAEPEGQVIDVDPAESTSIAPDTTITLTVSDGDTAIPDVRGLTQAAALEGLRAAGFTNITSQNVESDEVPEGQAVGTEPGANTQAGADDEIILLIAVPTPPEETTPTPPTTSTTQTPTTVSPGG